MSNLKNNFHSSYFKIFLILTFSIIQIIYSLNSKTFLDNKEFLASKCFDIIKSTKNDLSEFKKLILENIKEIKKDNNCLKYLIHKGKKQETDFLMLELSKREVNFRKDVAEATQYKSGLARTLLHDYKYEENDFATVSPAFQWAQNQEYLFLQIKYAHRFDAPGCIEAKNENILIEEKGNSFIFTAFCFQGETPIKIYLDLKFSDKIMNEGSSYGSSSVGRYEVKIKKANKGFWKKLFDKDFEPPKNMRMWLEMRDKYLDEIQKDIDKSEGEEENELMQEIESNKNKKHEEKNDL